MSTKLFLKTVHKYQIMTKIYFERMLFQKGNKFFNMIFSTIFSTMVKSGTKNKGSSTQIFV